MVSSSSVLGEMPSEVSGSPIGWIFTHLVYMLKSCSKHKSISAVIANCWHDDFVQRKL